MLTVISHAGYSGRNLYFNVECDCGNTKRVASSYLQNAKSCGCATGEKYPPLYEIPQSFAGIERKAMRDGKLLVFANGEMFRIKGKLFYKCSKMATSKGGRYECVTYKKDGKQVFEYVHRLMAEAFIPNPDNKEQVNHIDNDGHNNELKNIEWVTSSENCAHARDFLGNYAMKNAKMCTFCELVATRSALQVCESCSRKLDKVNNRKEKLKKLAEKFSMVETEKLSLREKSIVSLTLKGRTHEEVGESFEISRERVRQILQEILEKSATPAR